MIKIANNPVDANTILSKYSQNSIEAKIIKILAESQTVYHYDSLNQLTFELKLRRNIVKAARDLSKSGLLFRVFRKSKCNEAYWIRTPDGGFVTRKDVKPSDAIKDIYINSSKYGTECSTAMVIVYYKAMVDTFPENVFNRLFPQIYLMNWMHLNNAMGIYDYKKVADYLPGDCRYFKNPDVNPSHPEWQGENVFLLENGLYYGHGIGIQSGEKIIEALNKKRIKNSTVSAFLLPSAKRPNFKNLSNIYYSN